MTEPTALARQETVATAPMQPVNPAQMIQLAFQKAMESSGAEALAVADRILEQMAKQRDYDDRQRYNSALLRIQSKLGVVVKDAAVTGKGKYASSKAVDRAILAACREENFIFSFDSEDSGSPEILKLVCDCSINGSAYVHRYSLPLPISGMGPKGGGVMNVTDAACSAVTKGKRYLKNMVFNLRIEETDDEIRPGGMDQAEIDGRCAEIEEATSKATIAPLYFGAIEAARKVRDLAAQDKFVAARDKRLAQLEGRK